LRLILKAWVWNESMASINECYAILRLAIYGQEALVPRANECKTKKARIPYHHAEKYLEFSGRESKRINSKLNKNNVIRY